MLLLGNPHGWRSLVGCSPWGLEESDTTERLHFHFSLSCIGEGNDNPLQCSCLENPRDGGAWWAAVYGVAQSWTRLKQLISSSMWDPSHSTRGRTHVPHAGRQTLNHWTTKEVPGALALMSGRHLQFWVCDCAYTVKTGDKTVPPWSLW